MVKGKGLVAKSVTTNTSNPYVRVHVEGKQKEDDGGQGVSEPAVQEEDGVRSAPRTGCQGGCLPNPLPSVQVLSPSQSVFNTSKQNLYMLGFGYAAAKECLLCPFDSYEAVGMDSFMGYAELDLAKVKLPYRGNLDLFSGTHTCSPCEHQTVVLY